MFKYIVVCEDKIKSRGECKYYADFRAFVPYGYRYTWAHMSPGGLTINVEPGVQRRNLDVLDSRIQTASAWHKDKNEPYRMETA